MAIERFAGKRVSVLGLGREGLAVARVLAAEGACVTVSDTRDAAALAAPIAALRGYDVRYSLGGNRPEEVLDCDLLVLSPGVDKRAPLVCEALQRNIAISSETALFFERCPCKIVGVTGSAGKTTTTTLLGEMLRRAGAALAPGGVFVGGNIGSPLLERIPEMTPASLAVLELSSFQLEWLRQSPAVAVITNITPNHLDRHETMAAYVAAKSAIVRYQSSDAVAVLNADDQKTAELASLTAGRVLYFSLSGAAEGLHGADGAATDGDRLVLIHDGHSTVICTRGELPVPGRHNVANALAAAAAAAACGAGIDVIGAAIRDFRGVPHRLQTVATIHGVTFVDDSIATAPERTMAAFDALAGPLVAILGGRDKHLPWDELARRAVERCRGVALIGDATPLIRRHLEAALHDHSGPALLQPAAIVDVSGMAAAVAWAAGSACPGDTVLLSPGCASYDMYRDFEERGDHFAREVSRIGDHG